ncbi:MAG: formyl transferase [Henriciella sp.]|nr:formyl transferase [Henriciella sp.]
MPKPSPIVALTAGGPHAWIMINALRAEFGDFPVILEDPEPEDLFWARRRRLLGPLKVASMQAARLPIKLAKRGTGAVIDQIITDYGLKPERPADLQPIKVPSVNSKAAQEALIETDPHAVFVVSTRMIGARTLSTVKAPFINYHSGFNPLYRGMFGGYFALANEQPEYFGATVHLIDHGVDTGDILYQSRIKVHPKDNFHTYVWRIAAGSQAIVINAVNDALTGTLRPYTLDLPSRQYFAPMFGRYVWTGLTKGVW